MNDTTKSGVVGGAFPHLKPLPPAVASPYKSHISSVRLNATSKHTLLHNQTTDNKTHLLNQSTNSNNNKIQHDYDNIDDDTLEYDDVDIIDALDALDDDDELPIENHPETSTDLLSSTSSSPLTIHEPPATNTKPAVPLHKPFLSSPSVLTKRAEHALNTPRPVVDSSAAVSIRIRELSLHLHVFCFLVTRSLFNCKVLVQYMISFLKFNRSFILV